MYKNQTYQHVINKYKQYSLNNETNYDRSIKYVR